MSPHAWTAIALALLAILLGARTGTPRGRATSWTFALLWFLVALLATFAVGFWQRAERGDPFEWFHVLILTTTCCTVVVAAGDLVRAYREGRTDNHTPEP